MPKNTPKQTCPLCNLRIDSEEKAESTNTYPSAPKTATCVVCGMMFKAGDTELKVEGLVSEEVKDVVSRLHKQISDGRKENEELFRN